MKIYLGLILLMMVLIALTLAILFPYFPMVGSIISGLLFLLLVRLVLKKEFKITLPFPINCLLAFGIFADSIGNALDFYGKKWGPLWYDSWVHLFIPFCLSFSFFWLFNSLRLQKKLNVGQPLLWIFVFSLTFSLAAFYEVTELWDELYFGGKRIWGVHDTARDLQWDMAGIISGMLIYWMILKVRQKLKGKVYKKKKVNSIFDSRN